MWLFPQLTFTGKLSPHRQYDHSSFYINLYLWYLWIMESIKNMYGRVGISKNLLNAHHFTDWFTEICFILLRVAHLQPPTNLLNGLFDSPLFYSPTDYCVHSPKYFCQLPILWIRQSSSPPTFPLYGIWLLVMFW